jgi:hypothetical protein
LKLKLPELPVVREETYGTCGLCEAQIIDLEFTASGEWNIVDTGKEV